MVLETSDFIPVGVALKFSDSYDAEILATGEDVFTFGETVSRILQRKPEITRFPDDSFPYNEDYPPVGCHLYIHSNCFSSTTIILNLLCYLVHFCLIFVLYFFDYHVIGKKTFTIHLFRATYSPSENRLDIQGEFSAPNQTFSIRNSQGSNPKPFVGFVPYI